MKCMVKILFQISEIVVRIYRKTISDIHCVSKKVPTFKLSVTLRNRLIFDKVTESLKVGTFLRHSVLKN